MSGGQGNALLQKVDQVEVRYSGDRRIRRFELRLIGRHLRSQRGDIDAVQVGAERRGEGLIVRMVVDRPLHGRGTDRRLALNARQATGPVGRQAGGPFQLVVSSVAALATRLSARSVS